MFSVGEIVIYVGQRNEFFGNEVVICAGPMAGTILGIDGTERHSDSFYRIAFAGGGRPKDVGSKEHWAAEPQHLKRRDQYDGNTKITWGDMPYWKPKELVRV